MIGSSPHTHLHKNGVAKVALEAALEAVTNGPAGAVAPYFISCYSKIEAAVPIQIDHLPSPAWGNHPFLLLATAHEAGNGGKV
jgi:hypothetical protein